ncbi:hypothetical protein Rmet_6465 [Cupriavidus metallidurans CH34]|uniref:Uncharacterized protein n=1 Tax=Cupriavidus metallidurans (strain ATCC 43123 / DSM 2839 / NBRC 102507 / CH34) TaxID=266264 RepID=D3DXQ7_CUPMC|nr:hypothetical protein Rmet_6465 [Cupriavidus metallidurans CH34]
MAVSTDYILIFNINISFSIKWISIIID